MINVVDRQPGRSALMSGSQIASSWEELAAGLMTAGTALFGFNAGGHYVNSVAAGSPLIVMQMPQCNRPPKPAGVSVPDHAIRPREASCRLNLMRTIRMICISMTAYIPVKGLVFDSGEAHVNSACAREAAVYGRRRLM